LFAACVALVATLFIHERSSRAPTTAHEGQAVWLEISGELFTLISAAVMGGIACWLFVLLPVHKKSYDTKENKFSKHKPVRVVKRPAVGNDKAVCSHSPAPKNSDSEFVREKLVNGTKEADATPVCPSVDVDWQPRTTPKTLSMRTKEANSTKDRPSVDVPPLALAKVDTSVDVDVHGDGDVEVNVLHVQEKLADVSEEPLINVPAAQGEVVPIVEEPSTAVENPVWEAHSRGECKPCAYFWGKEDGCRQGAQCEFCHICDQDAMKRRKKQKKANIKKLKAETQSVEVVKESINALYTGPWGPAPTGGMRLPPGLESTITQPMYATYNIPANTPSQVKSFLRPQAQPFTPMPWANPTLSTVQCW